MTLESINPNNLKIITAFVEPSLTTCSPNDKFQFERHGCVVVNVVDHVRGIIPVFNLAIELKDRWVK